MAYKRIVERFLYTRRGKKPSCVEVLTCGHTRAFNVPYWWVEEMRFSANTTDARERFCGFCHDGAATISANRDSVEWRVILHEKYDLLTDIAKAFAKAEQEDLENGDHGVLPGGGVGKS